jgi:NADH dehydrogenase (ubiquinone) 1 alpha subcomplex subunit 10
MYNDYWNNTMPQLLRPHLVVYLDVPVSQTLQNIKKKAVLGEKESTIYTEKYLTSMEETLKNNYLKEIR